MAAEINCEGVVFEQRRRPLSGAKWTCLKDGPMSASDPYRHLMINFVVLHNAAPP